jgi:hypothetical protein
MIADRGALRVVASAKIRASDRCAMSRWGQALNVFQATNGIRKAGAELDREGELGAGRPSQRIVEVVLDSCPRATMARAIGRSAVSLFVGVQHDCWFPSLRIPQGLPGNGVNVY